MKVGDIMFKLFSKKKVNLFSCNNGNLIRIEDVPDDVFSNKLLGDGYCVQPNDGKVFSPISGIVLSIFPAKHAICLKSDEGLEILLHMGLDTVELNGIPFDIKVKVNDRVSPEVLLAEMDIKQVELSEKKTEIMIVIANNELMKGLELKETGYVKAGEKVGEVTLC